MVKILSIAGLECTPMCWLISDGLRTSSKETQSSKMTSQRKVSEEMNKYNFNNTDVGNKNNHQHAKETITAAYVTFLLH